MRVLYICPHLSTGGMPQYVLKMMQSLKHQYDVEVVEVNNQSNDYVVQRDKIKKEFKLHQLQGQQSALLKLIKRGNYDILHFQEIPETFLDEEILKQIYIDNRPYRIVVTTHSSYTDPSGIRFTADKYVLVSEWSRKVFNTHYHEKVPCDIWEYPIESKTYDKEAAKKEKHFRTDYKHVLHVGLFTPGKNQKELIEVARLCQNEKIMFHFVGNQAPNFEDYWKPLMANLPKNCIIHGEKSNVVSFLKASDAFYFPSLFELSPIALKEALSYGVPILIKPLHTYENTYDGIATYLTDDVKENKKLLLNVLGIEERPRRIQIIHLLTAGEDDRKKRSIEQLSKLQEFGIVYTQHVNEVYDGIPPGDFCKRPHQISTTGKSEYLGNGYGTLIGRHYGCFMAHTEALRAIDDENFDYTLIFEADASVETSTEQFASIIQEACDISEKEDVPYISFADNPSNSKTRYNNEFSLTKNQDLAHCYLIPNRYKNWYIDRIEDTPWDGYDIWLNDVFTEHPKKRMTTNKVYSSQIAGMSLIDGVIKWETTKSGNYSYIEIGTSDFDTLVEVYPEDANGLSIEPVKQYLDRLPEKPGNRKLNLAISDVDTTVNVYHLNNEDVIIHNLPEWTKGCNSINEPHPSLMRELMTRGLLDIYTKSEVRCISFHTLIDEYNIESVDYLKIDTEGHDFVILKNMLSTSLRPKKIRFEANSLYKEEDIQAMIQLLKYNNYILVQRTIDDVVMRWNDINTDDVKCPIMVVMSGRRLEYFERTIKALLDKNPNIVNDVEKVYVMDDRSEAWERLVMDEIMVPFGDKYTMVPFDSDEPFAFVEKFNRIKSLITKDDTVFLLEDDWECHDELHLLQHVKRLHYSDWTQIAFADPLDIQDGPLQSSVRMGVDYWRNPWPGGFKHPISWNGDVCHWVRGSINNYTNNPSLIKGEVFFRAYYILHKNFEASFAEQIGGNQVFTQEALFRHIGVNSLINQL